MRPKLLKIKRTAFFCTFSNLVMLALVKGSQTITPYSNTGRMIVLYARVRTVELECFRALRRKNSFRLAFVITESICLVQLRSLVIQRPRYLMLVTSERVKLAVEYLNSRVFFLVGYSYKYCFIEVN